MLDVGWRWWFQFVPTDLVQLSSDGQFTLAKENLSVICPTLNFVESHIPPLQPQPQPQSQFQRQRQSNMNPLEEIPTFIHYIEKISTSSPHILSDSRSTREIQIMSYFEINFGTIGKDLTYSVPWNKIRISCHPSSPVSPSESLYALNSSIVGLIHDPTSYSLLREDNQHGDSLTSQYPSFVLSPNIMSHGRCMGLGLVKSIDSVAKCFIIVTPVPPSELEFVNTLVMGQIEVPTPMLLKEMSPNTPYLSSDCLSSITAGARPHSSRLFVERLKYQ
eukprot:TRINITY_DN4248_c0_g1_i5.p1 TRINITY_DN4248_c0_g1~~TRINITY_DN4248_c0_g1_i5.p1  ORF type:complete len:276 (-),score=54.43 TRINITY_DN4248_c0_g1_i5:208-1035(-)